ncbi:uncharacterized protein LOC105178902 isoform X2 [Sesamum indicum]|uniref:Uncharacterized protein LOC105178902 isoform X2 n=1 Tax=Sesamum indicum TaxID=4182 RepID=A0A8M8V7W7_SESIN|nr:uncharacterized protein LOC105178902 isoform X2 [Sesamum indicum]
MHTCMQLGSQMIHARRRDELLTCGCGSTYWRLLITRVLTRTEMRYIILLETHNQVLQDVAAGLALLRRKSFTVPTCGHVDDVLSEAEEFSHDDYVSSAHILDISTHMYG